LVIREFNSWLDIINETEKKLEESDNTKLRYNIDKEGLHLGPFWFVPGYSPKAIITVLYASFASLAMLTLVNFIQPYLFQEVLKIPLDQQGKLTGSLAALQEIIIILVIGLTGAASDKIGRKILFSLGFILLAAGYFIYPYADSTLKLFLFRGIVAIGAAMIPVMLSACLVDTIQEISRGKWFALSSIFNGLGVLFMGTVLGQMPRRFEELGFNAPEAAKYTFWIATAICLMTAILLHLGLKSGPPPEVKKKPQIIKNFILGLSEARRNSRIALAYASAFIARGDLVVVGTFFSLWFVQIGAQQQIPTGQAMAKAGLLFGAVIQVSALSWAFIMGIICDRLDRVTAVALAFGIASVGYLTLGSIQDPFSAGTIIILGCVITGMGEISAVISSMALVGEEAPPNYRGAVVGVFNKTGAIGIIAATTIGGLLVDTIKPNAPFTMMGIFNLIICLVAIFVRLKKEKV